MRATDWRLVLVLVLGWSVCAGASRAESPAAVNKPAPPVVAAPAPLPGETEAASARQALLARDLDRGEKGMQRAWQAGWRRGEDAYNAACAAALLGRSKDAFHWLDEAVAAGLGDAAGAAADPDLASIRTLPQFGALLTRMRANERPPSKLELLARADQDDRAAITKLPPAKQPDFGMQIALRDHDRRRQAESLVKDESKLSGAELFAAALLFQHGDTVDDYRRARSYALLAVQRGEPRGRWLAAAAWDRWLVATGRPQRFGTQTVCAPDCKLAPFDQTITDRERARWDVPPLAELRHDGPAPPPR